jgi:hypothetical protein
VNKSSENLQLVWLSTQSATNRNGGRNTPNLYEGFSLSFLINFSDTKPEVLLPIKGNPVPFVLTNSWVDLPTEHLLNFQGSETLALWLVFEDLVDVSFRVLATDSREETHFYSIPIETSFKDYVELTTQVYTVTPADPKILVSLPLGGVVNFGKVQAMGDGKIISCLATLKGKTL